MQLKWAYIEPNGRTNGWFSHISNLTNLSVKTFSTAKHHPRVNFSRLFINCFCSIQTSLYKRSLSLFAVLKKGTTLRLIFCFLACLLSRYKNSLFALQGEDWISRFPIFSHVCNWGTWSCVTVSWSPSLHLQVSISYLFSTFQCSIHEGWIWNPHF